MTQPALCRPRRRWRSLVAATALVPPLWHLPLSVGVAQGSPGEDTAGRDEGADKGAGSTVAVQLLNIADFHGNLEPVSVNGAQTGGAAALSAYFQRERAAKPNTLLFTGGDAVGASPPISSFFQDRPTIEWMNTASFDVYALGNHDFDAGLPRLQSQIDAAKFGYLAANLVNLPGNLTGVAPYEVREVAGVKVAMIGLTNPEAPTLVAPGATGSIRITDPVTAAVKARKAAQREGATVFVAFGHLGVTGQDSVGNQTGPLVDFAKAVRGFDVIVGDHTDRQFQATINYSDPTGLLFAGINVTACAGLFGQACVRVSSSFIDGSHSVNVTSGVGFGASLSVNLAAGGNVPAIYSYFSVCAAGISVQICFDLQNQSAPPQVQVGGCFGEGGGGGQGISG